MRRASLTNIGSENIVIEILDWYSESAAAGSHAPFPDGVQHPRRWVQGERVRGGTRLGLFRLASIPADRPEPNEALRATTVWCEGLPAVLHLLWRRSCTLSAVAATFPGSL